MDTVHVKVEFSGLSHILTKVNDVEFDLATNQTYADIVHMLAEKYPALVGNVIEESKNDFYPSNVFSRNGKTIVLPEQMHECPQDGEVLILLSLLAGG